MPKPITVAEAARAALQVQDACNLSGVAHSFAEAVGALWEEARQRGQGTDFVNTHPISVLFASKLGDLARAESNERYAEALAECEGIVRESGRHAEGTPPIDRIVAVPKRTAHG